MVSTHSAGFDIIVTRRPRNQRTMDKTARNLYERCLGLLDKTGLDIVPAKKRHNIWAERPPKHLQPQPPTLSATTSQRRSPFNELPEELLLHILRSLDVPSLLVLRRASRKFMRLFGDAEFRRYHGISNGGRWQSENVRAIESNKELRLLRELIARDRLCTDCVAARTGAPSRLDAYHAWSETPLHCGGCGLDHPSCAFSKRQRALPASKRVCIAREGAVRLCRHKTLTWAEIERDARRAAAEKRGCVLFACENRHERREVRFAFYGTSYQVAVARGVAWRREMGAIEYDWDEDGKVPLRERDWCPDRDYTWLSAEVEVQPGGECAGGTLVPESFWYRLLDPPTFGLKEEGFGVTWCRARFCPNYWRCYELRRGRRVYIPCAEGCQGGCS